MIDTKVLVGNPTPASRTTQIATLLADRMLAKTDTPATVIELAEYTSRVFDRADEQLQNLVGEVARTELLIVATPTYKASYTGLLKAFLDRYGYRGLEGVVAIPMMTGADLRHAMAPDTALRPLLVELGAVVPTAGLYFVVDEIDRAADVIDAWIDDARGRLQAHLPAVLSETPHPR